MSICTPEISLPEANVIMGHAIPETIYCQYIDSIYSIAQYKAAGGNLDDLIQRIHHFYENDHQRKQMTLLVQAIGDKELTIEFLTKKLSLGTREVSILKEHILPESILSTMPLNLSPADKARFIAEVSRNALYQEEYPEKPI